MARREQETEEQLHLRDKDQLKKGLHDKDKQYQQLIRHMAHHAAPARPAFRVNLEDA